MLICCFSHFACCCFENNTVKGADFIDISATDQHFCDDCAYQIGLTSAANASYTVSVYRGDEGGERPTKSPLLVLLSLSLALACFPYLFSSELVVRFQQRFLHRHLGAIVAAESVL